jgi:hypothetical protein
MCSSFRISFNLDLCKLLPCDWMRLNAAECAAATEERLCPEAVGAGSLTTDGCDLPWLAVNLDSELTGLSGRRICMNLPLQSQTGHRRFDWGPCNEIWVSLAWYCTTITTFFAYTNVQTWSLNLLMQEVEVSGHIRTYSWESVVYVILCLDFWSNYSEAQIQMTSLSRLSHLDHIHMRILSKCFPHPSGWVWRQKEADADIKTAKRLKQD